MHTMISPQDFLVLWKILPLLQQQMLNVTPVDQRMGFSTLKNKLEVILKFDGVPILSVCYHALKQRCAGALCGLGVVD